MHDALTRQLEALRRDLDAERHRAEQLAGHLERANTRAQALEDRLDALRRDLDTERAARAAAERDRDQLRRQLHQPGQHED
ncbi:hypothetical protein TH66_00295 [Carbonactinospora thermoautotrophica]|uniref:Uncharacterized protein n=1 Tax=Carbonactinospora thermoautotrophica TaxID=1469144 RepID=A0A132N770_9ACTN|nr:hypothetical protein [Carbonactinospora thermoautotrophica]KWX05989.1 hypothetical protein TH66_00295 [Carbonactinospora thermoautotrophica]